MIRVLIADDQTLVRSGLRLVLEGREGIEVVGEAANGEEAVRSVRRFQPDLVLMDVRMPVMEGLEATRRILKDGDDCRVVVVTTFDLDEYIYAATAAGVSGFLLAISWKLRSAWWRPAKPSSLRASRDV